MAEEVKGIKEISELIDGVAVLAKAGFEVAKDKKITLEDLGVLGGLAGKMDVLLAAFSGVEEIPAEIKDLSLEELQALVMKLITTVAAVKAA